jgi:hypothetical protein
MLGGRKVERGFSSSRANLTREYFFSASLPDDRGAAYESTLGEGSYRVFLDMFV